MYKYLIIVPTVADRDVLPTFFSNLLNKASEDTLIAISVNPFDMEEADKVVSSLNYIYESEKVLNNINKNVKYQIIWSDKPIGFSGAINKAYTLIKSEISVLPDNIIICSDDIVVTENWQDNLCSHFQSRKFITKSSLNRYHLTDQTSDLKVIEDIYQEHKIGLVGPRSTGVYNLQRISNKEIKVLKEIGIEEFSNIIFNGVPNASVIYPYLSGFCFAISKELAEKLESNFSYGGFLDADTFKIGGYEDNDVSKRAYNLGYMSCIATNCFIHHIGHLTLDKYFKSEKRGRNNKLNYYLKYKNETQTVGNVIGAYRVSFKCVNDLVQFKLSISKSLEIIDGAAILFTNNPADCIKSYDSNLLSQLQESDRVYLEQCSNADSMEKLKQYTENWIDIIKSRNNRSEFITSVEFWTSDFNERDERNRTHEMAEDLDADWIISIDADEFFEDRITRKSFMRVLTHPNPDSIICNVSWINHWETTQLVRNDPPFTNGYKSGMTGPRIWKVNKNLKYRIHAGNNIGLHCGNSPELSDLNYYSSSIRFRHLSHVRAIDRYMKARFYTNIDREKDVLVLGSSDYSHISKQENIPVSLYNSRNGIALSMLAYSGEDPFQYSRTWEELYSVVDRIVLGWTDTWSDSDKSWINMTIEDILTIENWFETGPSKEFALYIKFYKVDVIHCEFSEDTGLSACRNATFDEIENNGDKFISWILFLDPDETPNTSQCSSLIRMAEANDCLGWSFKFDNLINNSSDKAFSESIRMFKIDGRGAMRMNGKVHEGFDTALKILTLNGIKPRILECPITYTNHGLNKRPDLLSSKLIKYKNLLLNELNSNPLDSGAWVSLGLQLINDGYSDKAKLCFERACMCGGTAYMPFKEMGLLLMRESKAYLLKSLQRTKSNHPYHKMCIEMLKMLDQMAPSAKILQTDQDISEGLELPSFPYDRIGIDEYNEFIILEEKDGLQD